MECSALSACRAFGAVGSLSGARSSRRCAVSVVRSDSAISLIESSVSMPLTSMSVSPRRMLVPAAGPSGLMSAMVGCSDGERWTRRSPIDALL
eukprot:666690-Prymnesium_polylepis.1